MNTRDKILLRRRGMMTAQAVPQDGQLEWIETDGVAYIDTGVNGKTPMSVVGRILLPNTPSTRYYVLGHGNIDGNSDTINFLWKSAAQTAKLGYGIYYIYSSVVNFSGWGSYFDFRTKLQYGLCSLGVRVVGDTNWTEASATINKNIKTGALYLFATNVSNTAYYNTPSGTRIASVEIYNTASYTSPLRNYVPWRLNGEVGLMDTLTNTFYGNAAGSGAFTGGPNVI